MNKSTILLHSIDTFYKHENNRDILNQILNKSVIPADISKNIIEKAQQQAKLIAEKLDYIGSTI